MAKRYYELHVSGCTRHLPVLNISDKVAIAGFVILGDVEIVENTARDLAAKVPKDCEYVMTAETKGIPLAAELARNLGQKTYLVARKSVKAYMDDPICVEDESITTMGKQKLYLSASDVALIRGKKVLLVDDVISTGGSMKALKELAEKRAPKSAARLPFLPKAMQRSVTISYFLKNFLFWRLNKNESRIHEMGMTAFLMEGIFLPFYGKCCKGERFLWYNMANNLEFAT